MSTEESRKDIYKRARKSCSINKNQWGRVMSLGVLEGNMMSSVGKKEKAPGEPHSRGVPMSEALAAGLLEYLYKQGKNIEGIEFDEEGNILNIPDRV